MKKLNKLFDITNLLVQDKILYIDDCIESHLKNKNKKEIKIADFGSNVGNTLLPLLRLGHKIDAYEPNKKRLDILRERANKENLQDRVTLFCSSVENASSDKKYDLIMLIEVLEHTENPMDVLKKINSFLKDGGMLILTVPNGFCLHELFITRPVIWLRNLFNIKMNKGYYHLHFFSFSRLRRMINKSGFKIDGFRKTSLFPYFPILSSIKFLQKIDLILSKIMPYYLVGGWQLRCIKKK